MELYVEFLGSLVGPMEPHPREDDTIIHLFQIAMVIVCHSPLSFSQIYILNLSPLHLLPPLFLCVGVHVCVQCENMDTCVCHSSCVKVRGQLRQSSLPPCLRKDANVRNNPTPDWIHRGKTYRTPSARKGV